MELYRISQESYFTDLSGNGSRLFGGRWNSEGRYALYTSANRSLALLETLVHTPLQLLHANKYILITIFLPDKTQVKFVDEKDLPGNWDALGIQPVTQKIGDNFLDEQKKLLMKVPSVLMPEEFNFVINPLHPAMKQVRILHQREIRFNDRLTKVF